MLNTTIRTIAAEKAIVLAMSTRELVDAFEETNRMVAAAGMSQITADVRGWLMNELKARDSRAFWDWVDSEQDSPREYFFPSKY